MPLAIWIASASSIKWNDGLHGAENFVLSEGMVWVDALEQGWGDVISASGCVGYYLACGGDI